MGRWGIGLESVWFVLKKLEKKLFCSLGGTLTWLCLISSRALISDCVKMIYTLIGVEEIIRTQLGKIGILKRLV